VIIILILTSLWTTAATPTRGRRLVVTDGVAPLTGLRHSCFVATFRPMHQLDANLLFYIGQPTYADALREFQSGASASFYIEAPSNFTPANSAKARRDMRRTLLRTIAGQNRCKGTLSDSNLSTHQLKSGLQIRPTGQLWVVKVKSKVRIYSGSYFLHHSRLDCISDRPPWATIL
jgi:hypothetical protein